MSVMGIEVGLVGVQEVFNMIFRCSKITNLQISKELS